MCRSCIFVTFIDSECSLHLKFIILAILLFRTWTLVSQMFAVIFVQGRNDMAIFTITRELGILTWDEAFLSLRCTLLPDAVRAKYCELIIGEAESCHVMLLCFFHCLTDVACPTWWLMTASSQSADNRLCKLRQWLAQTELVTRSCVHSSHHFTVMWCDVMWTR